MAQHLVAVDAAAEISAAQVEGASLHSMELSFIPGKVKSGRYRFNIRTAGSASLVLQTIFLPLSRASSSSSFQITGGTHVPWSPCFHYLDLQWLPYLLRIGFDADLILEKAGFFPQGGGQIRGTIRPAGNLSPLAIDQRGKLISIEGISAVANLKIEIAERQKRQAMGRLLKSLSGADSSHIRIRIMELSSYGKGTLLLLKGNFESGSCCFFSLGEIGKPAERVADQAVDEFLGFLETDGAVDPYLADQLLLPLILATGPSQIRTSEITPHLLTNAAVLEAFLPGGINIQGQPGKSGTIVIHPGK
jgi:RNA 3'-terminal phosphate cyclase (ATP)